MKRAILSFVMLGSILGCNSNDKHIDENTNETIQVGINEQIPEETNSVSSIDEPSGNKNEGTVYISKLNSDEFRKKVFDYKKHKEWVFEGDRPCIIDFYADWCGPCKMLTPRLEKIAKQYAGKINVYKVNTDEQTEISQAFGIQSLPTILFCPKGSSPQAGMGLISESDLKKAVDEFLLKQ